MVFPSDMLALKGMSPSKLLEIYRLQDPAVREFLRSRDIACSVTHGRSPAPTPSPVSSSSSRNTEDIDDDETPSASLSTPSSRKRVSRDFLIASDSEPPSKAQRTAIVQEDSPRANKTAKGHRQRVKWTDQEIENLVRGVKECGEGHWKEIMAKYTFVNRSNIDLKDKWRNLTRRYHVEELFSRLV